MKSERRLRHRHRRRHDAPGGEGNTENGKDSSLPTTRVLVQYESAGNNDDGGRQNLLKMLGKSVLLDSSPNRGGIIVADVNANILRRLEKSRHVKRMETLDQPAPFRSHVSSTSTHDPHRHLKEILTPAIQMVQADLLDIGSSPPLICVADSGYALGHPDLPVPPQVDGMDYTLANGKVLRWYHDGTGHGTATAGVVAAIEGNGIGFRGVAPELTLFITRALDDNGRSDVAQLIGAIEQCVASGAKIVSMSLGCPCTDFDHCKNRGCYSEIMKAYFASINENGVLVFGAAGNEGTVDQPFYPGSYESVISVGGVTQGRDKFDESSVHNQVELAAMGETVFSTFAKQTDNFQRSDYTYTYKTGTSIAVPAVAASAALLWSHFPDCTNHQIRTALDRTAWNPNACDDRLGFGVVQVRDAYDLLSNRGCELDGQIFAGATSACDGYATLTPTVSPTTSTAPTRRPTAAPAEAPRQRAYAAKGFEWWVFLVLVVGAIIIGYGLYVLITQLILPRSCSKKDSDTERRKLNGRRPSSRKSSTGRSSKIDGDARKSSVARGSINNEDDIRSSNAVRNSTRAITRNEDSHRRSSNHRSSTRSSTKASMRQSSSCKSLRESTRQSTRRSSHADSSRRSRSADRRSTTRIGEGPPQSTLRNSTINTKRSDSISPRSTTDDGPRQSTLRSSTTSTRQSDNINNTQVKKSFKDKEKQDCVDHFERRMSV